MSAPPRDPAADARHPVARITTRVAPPPRSPARETMDGVAAPPPHPLDETTRRSDGVGPGMRPADVAAARRPEAFSWTARAISAVAVGTTMAAGFVEAQLATVLPGVTASWLTTRATDRLLKTLARGAETPATVTAAVATGLAMRLAALTAAMPIVAANGGVAGVMTGLLLAAWLSAGWRHPATGAAAALRQRLAAVCAAEAAAAVVLLFAAGGPSVGFEPDSRVAAAAACAFALQAAVAIGVARTVPLPAAPMGGSGWAAAGGGLPPAGTAFDPSGPVRTWAAEGPAAARTSVLVTAGLAAGPAAAAVAAAGVAAATHYLRPAAPGAVVAVAALVPVLVVAAAAVAAWRWWVRASDSASWCKGGGSGAHFDAEAAPLVGVFESPSRQP